MNKYLEKLAEKLSPTTKKDIRRWAALEHNRGDPRGKEYYNARSIAYSKSRLQRLLHDDTQKWRVKAIKARLLTRK